MNKTAVSYVGRGKPVDVNSKIDVGLGKPTLKMNGPDWCEVLV